MACSEDDNVVDDQKFESDDMILHLENLHLSPISCSSGSETDGSYTSDRETGSKLPSCTSKWKIVDLETVNIFYHKDFKTVTQILDMIHDKTGMFGQLTPEAEQKICADKLKDSMTFSFSSKKTFMYQFAASHLQSLMQMDRNETEDVRTEDFIDCIEKILIIACSRRGDVSEAAFVDLFKAFVRMNGLRYYEDIDVRPNTKEVILKQSVSSQCDMLLATKDYVRTNHLSTGVPFAVVSVVEDKNMKADMKGSTEEKELPMKTRPVTHQTESSSDFEKNVDDDPAVFSRIKTKVLAQHGGELLLHSSIFEFRPEFINEETMTAFYPGMFVVGTQVVFTVLAMNLEHFAEIKRSAAVENGRSYLYYSEPKDLLLKEDRDLLIESFARLKNRKEREH